MHRKYVDYYDYIETDKWRAKSTTAKKRAGWRCQICNTAGNYSQLAAHHRTYDRLGDELPEDITVLCHSCHELYEMARKEGKLPTPPYTSPSPIYEPPPYVYEPPPYVQTEPTYKPPVYEPPPTPPVKTASTKSIPRYRKKSRARQVLYIVGFPLLIVLLIFLPALLDIDIDTLNESYERFFVGPPIGTPTRTPTPTITEDISTPTPTTNTNMPTPTKNLTPPPPMTYTYTPTPHPTSTATKAPTRHLTPTPMQIIVCECGRDVYDCNDFTPRSSAQLCYDYCISKVGHDVHWLDADNDGQACE